MNCLNLLIQEWDGGQHIWTDKEYLGARKVQMQFFVI